LTIALVFQYDQVCHCGKGNISMRRTGIGATLIMSMLIAGTLGFGLAIRHGMIAPPELDLRAGLFRILAVVVSPAHSPADAVSRPCAPWRGGCCNPRQEFYLVWVLAQTGAIDRGRQISIRVLTLPLQCT
jgi:hypothetical protein